MYACVFFIGVLVNPTMYPNLKVFNEEPRQ